MILFVFVDPKGRGFDSHRGQANVSACPVWMHTQSNITNIVTNCIKNFKRETKYFAGSGNKYDHNMYRKILFTTLFLLNTSSVGASI